MVTIPRAISFAAETEAMEVDSLDLLMDEGEALSSKRRICTEREPAPASRRATEEYRHTSEIQ